MSDFYVVLSLCIYLAVATAFLAETYAEGERVGGFWDRDRVIGLLMCTVWPALTCAVAVAAIWSSKSTVGLTPSAQ